MRLSITANLVKAALPKRRAESHKGDFGTLCICAGSQNYPGAAVLCTGGALRAGAGIVRLAAPDIVCAAVAAHHPCCTFLPGASAGQVLATRPSALLAGPGLGNTEATAALVAALLTGAPCPLVLDADALNALAGSEGLRRAAAERIAPLILTPHPGEMARLADLGVPEVTQDPAGHAAALAAKLGCVVVLKGHVTHIAGPDGEAYVNEAAGNAGLAKGGSGDVLAGIIAALAGQGIEPAKAAAAGVWLHAKAADLLAEGCGLYALSPADLPGALASVFKAIQR